ncbi:hypothetical protein [Paraburkholderia jirisanensis]
MALCNNDIYGKECAPFGTHAGLNCQIAANIRAFFKSLCGKANAHGAPIRRRSGPAGKVCERASDGTPASRHRDRSLSAAIRATSVHTIFLAGSNGSLSPAIANPS